MIENKLIVEIVEDFEIVPEGKVYPEVIKAGELVEGRVAEVALQLEKGVKQEAAAAPKGGQSSTQSAPANKAQSSVPETKAAPFADDGQGDGSNADLLSGSTEGGAEE